MVIIPHLRWAKAFCLMITLIAIGLFSRPVLGETVHASSYYRAAVKALDYGNPKRAIVKLKLAVQANPLDSRAHYLLGELLARQGAPEQAIVAFQRAVWLDPTHSQALHNLGTLLLRRGEAIPAAELLEAAISNNPGYIPPYNSLAKAYFLADLPELAMTTYQEVLRLDPANAVASQNLHLLLAAADDKAGDPDNAKPDQAEKKLQPLPEPPKKDSNETKKKIHHRMTKPKHHPCPPQRTFASCSQASLMSTSKSMPD